jgi:DNA-binding NarL/FixJ family response regulator
MNSTNDYVLVLDQHPEDFQAVEKLLQGLKCPAVVADSPDQVFAHIDQDFPYLMILVGNHQDWPKAVLNELRYVADNFGGTILSLTTHHMPSWIHQEDNPGFDGFLVEPLSPDVLISLIQCAWVKQVYSVKHCPLPRQF